MTVAEIINSYLPQFDKTDEVYRALIADPNGVPNNVINTPKDYNQGALANILQWLSNFASEAHEQLSLATAVPKWFDFIVENFIGVGQYNGESYQDFLARIVKIIMSPKLSPASIIYATTIFSSPGLPVIYEGERDFAYADLTFSDVYLYRFISIPGHDPEDTIIFPAIAAGVDAGIFTFLLVLQNTNPADITQVIDIVRRWKAAGINYQIRIDTV